MKSIRLVSLMSLGALAMYFLDPRLGRRRRTLLRERLSSSFKNGTRFAQKTTRDLQHRLKGAAHRLGEKITSKESEISDSILEARVRSKIGRHLNHHPHTFDVQVKKGDVVISGFMSPSIYQKIYPIIRKMEGIHSVQLHSVESKAS